MTGTSENHSSTTLAQETDITDKEKFTKGFSKTKAKTEGIELAIQIQMFVDEARDCKRFYTDRFILASLRKAVPSTALSRLPSTKQ